MPASLTALILTLLAAAELHAATASNANSPLGINLTQMDYWSSEQPFLNIFKTTAVSQNSVGWLTHSSSTWDTGEEAYLQLDANGYPTTLTASSSDPHSPQIFNSVGVELERELPNSNSGTGLPYRPGRYVVLYEGQGKLSYGFDATLVSSAPGRDVINVATPTSAGIDLRITATDTDPRHKGNYIRNIRVVKAEEEALLNGGAVFRPGFVSLLQNFSVVRGMQWLNLDEDGGLLTTWSSRPHQTDGGWGSNHGVPLEVLLQLCNAAATDCWLNVPHQANDDYIAQMATVAHAALGANQKLYIEYSNEVWNSAYAQYKYAVAQGQTVWPGARVTADDYNRNWYGMRTAQMCDIWNSVWDGDSSRVVCVLGAQAANPWTATEALSCPLWGGTGNAPCSAHHVNAVAIAPYFGYEVPSAWTSQPDGGLSSLFASMTTRNDPSIPQGGWLGQASRWEAAYRSALAPFDLPMIAYEGGQTFVGFPGNKDGSPMVKLYIAANRDSRMGTAYTTALNDWKSNGGQVYAIYSLLNGPGQYGEWGALESFMDTVSPLASAPPKWQAIQNFISGNKCWWAACTGMLGTTAAAAAPMH
jgi:hypothetical protein